MREEVRWTDLTPRDIQEALSNRGLDVSTHVIRRLLDDEGFRRRAIQKYLDMGIHPDRNAQFENIARIKAEALEAGIPLLSIDTKKKELLGTFYRDGKVYTRQQPLFAYDHDFPSHASGVVIPYGLYDLRLNFGYINLGNSRDTTAFACDSLEWWWTQHGQRLYPTARSICLLCDGGGSNSANKHLFKYDLKCLSDRLGLEFRIAHYPPYCSKYNPIERRLFCHMTRACQGVLFDSQETVQRLIEKTHTATGLGVAVHTMNKEYPTGRACPADFKKAMPVLFDEVLPKWNYRVVPKAP